MHAFSPRNRWLTQVSICLLFIALAACSDSEISVENEPDAGSTQPDAQNDVRFDQGSPASDMERIDQGGEGQPDSGDEDSGTPTSESKEAFCEGLSLEIREAAGATIEVTPGSDGQVMVDGQSMTLRQAVSSASEGDTVLLADGTYTFAANPDGSAFTGIYITTPNVTLRSASGDPEAVVIDSNYRDHGNGSAPITLAAPGVTVADLTVRRSIYHLVHIWEDGDQATLHNLRLIDGGQQFVKSSGGEGTIDDVRITCSDLTMTDDGRDNVWGYGAQDGNTTCYTGGIDSHEGQGWEITDNYFEGIYCDASGVQRPAHGKNPDARGGETYQGGLAEHAIHMWDSPQGVGGHLIARNHIMNCARGVGLGFRDEVYDTVITDNMIFSSFAGSREHDVGISVERSQNTAIMHNTVFYTHPNAYPNTIEYRFDTTANLRVMNNLTNGQIRARNGANAVLEDNLTEAESSWFVDADAGNLRLTNCDTNPAVSAAQSSESDLDFDHDARQAPADVGADECRER